MPEKQFSITSEGTEFKTKVEINLLPMQDETFQNCIASLGNPNLDFSPNVGELVNFFEEEMLIDLYKEKDSFTNLKATFSELMKSLKVNFYIFIGHINMCEDFVKKVNSEIEKDTSDNPLFGNTAPVIVFFIACMGTDQAVAANSSDTWKQSRFVAMGINDLVHIYHGEIYACKTGHLALPTMSCYYDGAEEDYKKIVTVLGLNPDALQSDELEKAREELGDNPLVQCCDSKIKRFRSVFLQYLRKRNCVVFHKEQLQQKIKNILNDDGTIDSRKLDEGSNYIFYQEDGIPCTNESDCQIFNPYEANEKIASEFNSRSTILKLFNNFEDYAYKKDVSREEKDQVTLKKLQALRPEEKNVMRYSHQGTTLLHAFAANGLLKSLQYILKKSNPNLESQGTITGDTYLHKLIASPYIKDDNEIMPFLFELLNTDGPRIFQLRNHNNEDGLSIAVYKHRLSVIQFYADKIFGSFRDLFYGEDGYNLLFQACTLYPFYSEKSFKIVQLLLSMGVDPNHIYDGADIFHYYMSIWFPPYSKKIFREICNYRYSYIGNIDHIIKTFTDIVTNPLRLIQKKQESIDMIKKLEEELEDPNLLVAEKQRATIYLEMLELFQIDGEKQYRDAIAIFKECRAIVVKGGKKNRQLAGQSLRVLANTRKNVNTTNLRIQSKEKIPDYYKSIDEYIKVVGKIFNAEEKKEYRRRGIEIVRNNAGNSIERLQSLRELLEEIEDEAVKRGYYQNVSNTNSTNSYNYRYGRRWGGKRFRKTRKNLKSRRTRRKVTK